MNRKIVSLPAPCFALAVVLSFLPGTAQAGYIQNNLVSDVPGLAAVTDPNLLNPWGLSFSATSPFWVADEASNDSTLYSNIGVVNSRVVSVPGGPTGTVFNSAPAGNFLDSGTSANFLFDTLGGSIYAWNAGNGSAAQLEALDAGRFITTGDWLSLTMDRRIFSMPRMIRRAPAELSCSIPVLLKRFPAALLCGPQSAHSLTNPLMSARQSMVCFMWSTPIPPIPGRWVPAL